MSNPAIASLINTISENSRHLADSDVEDNQTAKREIVKAARKLINELESENPMEQFGRLGWGEPTRTAAVQALFEMGLLQKLDMQSPVSSVQLVEGTIADPVLVARMLKHLASFDIVRETGQDQYLATPFTMATNDPIMAASLKYVLQGGVPVFTALPQYLAETQYRNPVSEDNGGPLQFGLKTDKPFFAAMEEKGLTEAFNQFMAGYAKAQPRWIDYYPCEEQLLGPYQIGRTANNTDDRSPVLVDVGGGLGHEIAAFAAMFGHRLNTTTSPANKAGGEVPEKPLLILEDTSNTLNQLESLPADDPKKLPNTVQPVPHDFFQPQPPIARNAHAYFLRQILHDWPDDKSRVILSHLRDAMRSDGMSKILINEIVVADTNASWQQTSLDMVMMSLLVSRERTRSQWKNLLDSVGLRIERIYTACVSGEGESVIEAVLA